MLSLFNRSDDQFIDAALLSDKRAAMLTKLRRTRKILNFALTLETLCLFGEVFLDRSDTANASRTILGLTCVVFIVILRDLAVQIWILELLQRKSLPPAQINKDA
jgi:hypothetical protein